MVNPDLGFEVRSIRPTIRLTGLAPKRTAFTSGGNGWATARRGTMDTPRPAATMDATASRESISILDRTLIPRSRRFSSINWPAQVARWKRTKGQVPSRSKSVCSGASAGAITTRGSDTNGCQLKPALSCIGSETMATSMIPLYTLFARSDDNPLVSSTTRAGWLSCMTFRACGSMPVLTVGITPSLSSPACRWADRDSLSSEQLRRISRDCRTRVTPCWLST